MGIFAAIGAFISHPFDKEERQEYIERANEIQELRITERTERKANRQAEKTDRVEARQDGKSDRTSSRQDGRNERTETRQEEHTARTEARQAPGSKHSKAEEAWGGMFDDVAGALSGDAAIPSLSMPSLDPMLIAGGVAAVGVLYLVTRNPK